MKVGKFIEIYKILKRYNFKVDDINDIEVIADLVAVYTGMKKEEVYQLKTSDANNYIKQMAYELDELMKKTKGKSLPNILSINGKKVKFAYILSDLTFGAFIDMQLIVAEINEKRINPIEVMDKILCSLILVYDDDIKKYKYKSFDTIDIVREIDFSDAYPIFAFFLTFKRILVRHIQDYLSHKERTITKLIKKALNGLQLK